MTTGPDETDRHGDDEGTAKPTLQQDPPATEQDPPSTEQEPPSPAGTSSPEEAAAAGGSDSSPPAQGEGEPDSW